MMARAVLACAAGILLVAAQQPPPLPDIVASRVVEGRFEPGNFDYLRGYFPEGSDEEKADYATLAQWLDQCEADGTARIAAELLELGATLSGERVNGAASLCRQVLHGDQFAQFNSYAELESASREARLVFNTLVEAIRLSGLRVQPITPNLARDLEVRTIGEQLLRLSLSWTYDRHYNPRLPQLSEAGRVVFDALVQGELARVDFENTQWLKQQVQEKGWPRYSEVGEKASDAAWLLVQHADHDPAFQLKVLRLMEPLLATNEVNPGNYAYLYDRITLKLTGKQRYGTQFWCEDGKMQPRPLEQPDRVAELRETMQLAPLSEYAGYFRRTC